MCVPTEHHFISQHLGILMIEKFYYIIKLFHIKINDDLQGWSKLDFLK
jgi:hypothetical protein